MNISNPLVRVLAAALPLVLIALIAGTAGYMSQGTEREPIPPLQEQQEAPEGIAGTVQGLSGDELAIIAEDGSEVRLRLSADTAIEMLRPITPAELAPGDWINGGAIPHAQTTLALVGLVLIEDPVVETP